MRRLLALASLSLAFAAPALADVTWARVAYRTDPALLAPGQGSVWLGGFAVTADGHVLFGGSYPPADPTPVLPFYANLWTWTETGGARS